MGIGVGDFVVGEAWDGVREGGERADVVVDVAVVVEAGAGVGGGRSWEVRARGGEESWVD